MSNQPGNLKVKLHRTTMRKIVLLLLLVPGWMIIGYSVNVQARQETGVQCQLILMFIRQIYYFTIWIQFPFFISWAKQYQTPSNQAHCSIQHRLH